MRGRWLTIFFFSPRRGISIKAAFDVEDPNDPVRSTVKALADRHGAIVVGDDGETYAL